jgi:hypothetical protein
LRNSKHVALTNQSVLQRFKKSIQKFKIQKVKNAAVESIKNRNDATGSKQFVVVKEFIPVRTLVETQIKKDIAHLKNLALYNETTEVNEFVNEMLQLEQA